MVAARFDLVSVPIHSHAMLHLLFGTKAHTKNPLDTIILRHRLTKATFKEEFFHFEGFCVGIWRIGRVNVRACSQTF